MAPSDFAKELRAAPASCVADGGRIRRRKQSNALGVNAKAVVSQAARNKRNQHKIVTIT